MAKRSVAPASISMLGLLVVPAVHAAAQTDTQSSLALPATAVTSVYEQQSYKASESRSAMKIDAPLRDIPQTVNVVPESVIKDQGAQSMEDVLKNVPGIGLSNGDGQRDQVTIRGFSAIGDMYIDGVRDDALYFRDLSNIERVEVIKGPAAVLYGRGSSGGLINSISKKPSFTPKREVGMNVDSEGKRRTQFDTGWADPQSNQAYRVDRNNTLADSSPTRFVTAPDGELLIKLNRGNVARDEYGVFNQTELKQQAQLAGMQHNLLYGVEAGFQDKYQRVLSQTNVAQVPVYRDALVPVPEHAANLSSKGTNFQQTTGLYVQDMIELNAHWKALVGVRYDIFGQEYDDDRVQNIDLDRTDKTWSPRAGLVYQPDAIQSYYVSVSRSYQPSGEVFAVSPSNQHLEPEETTNYEIGAKWDLLDSRLSLTAAVFRLERTNMKTADPANPNLTVLAGEQRTDGFEATVSGHLTDKWQIYAGYAYLDAEITKSNSKTNGVANEGQTPTLTPRNSANVWLVRTLTPEWRVAAGANYVDERYTALDNVVVMPGYTTFDAALLYSVPQWDAALRLKNVFDRDYYASAHGSVDLITPGAPRTLEASFNYRF